MKHMKKLIKPAAIFFAFAMLLSMTFPFTGFSAAETASRLQPYLAEMAAASPDEMVRVIVQKADDTDRAERFAEKLGAEIFADLGIINGFAAWILGSQIETLASHASVQWVSYDAPMTFSSGAIPVYYSVGTSTADLKAGSPKMTISSGTATFSVAQPNKIGVGDAITYNGSSKVYISGRNSATSFKVITKTGAIPANVSNATVNSIKRTFNSLSAAEANSLGSSYLGTNDLPAGNFELHWPCYNDGAMNDNLEVDGYITDADHFIRIYTPYQSSEVGASQRHTGQAGTGFRLLPGDNRDGIKILIAYVYVEGLEISVDDTNWESGIWITDTPSGSFYLSDNLIHGLSDYSNYGIALTSVDFDTWLYISNNFIYRVDMGISLSGSAITGYIYNNSFYYVRYGIDEGYNTTTVKNNVALTCAETCFQSITTQSNNISSDGSAAGTGSKTNKSASNNFVSTSTGSEDLHLKDGADALGAGADLDSDPYLPITDDIDGEGRPSSAPDIGADEHGSAPLPTPTPTDPPPGPTPTPTDPPPGPTPTPTNPPPSPIPTDPPSGPGSNTTNTYLETLKVNRLQEVNGSPLTGGNIVAVIDSGVNYDADFKAVGAYADRIVAHISGVDGQVAYYFSSGNDSCKPTKLWQCWYVTDQYGHGTHVAGIIAGDGGDSSGLYEGIAPGAKIINFRVADQSGLAHESGIVDALQLILEYNSLAIPIRVVNISINSTVEQSYNQSPLNAALEILWFHGIVIVASAGNTPGVVTAPANDPYVITVGAAHENYTANRSDDTIPTWSSYGVTMDGYQKPDIYAPGKDIISVLSDNSPWDTQHPDRVVGNGQYFRMSGTSVAAPMVSGAVAILRAMKWLEPDQIKYILMHTGTDISSNGQSGKYLDILGAANYVQDCIDSNTCSSVPYANQGNLPHMLLRQAALIAYYATHECEDPVEQCDLSSVNWSSVNWNSVNWASVNWASVNWNSVNWSSVNWSSVNWSSVNWSSVNWSSVNWASVNWSSNTWYNAVNWASVNWNSVNWNSTAWDD